MSDSRFVPAFNWPITRYDAHGREYPPFLHIPRSKLGTNLVTVWVLSFEPATIGIATSLRFRTRREVRDFLRLHPLLRQNPDNFYVYHMDQTWSGHDLYSSLAQIEAVHNELVALEATVESTLNAYAEALAMFGLTTTRTTYRRTPPKRRTIKLRGFKDSPMRPPTPEQTEMPL